MQIQKGIVAEPLKVVVYGPEGIGKSTLASKFPAPLFFDLEAGTKRLNVDRVDVRQASVLREMLASAGNQIAQYKTIVLDTVDALDWMFARELCAAAKLRDIEDWGFGKGYEKLAAIWKSFLDELTRFGQLHQVHIVMLAHSTMRKFELPDQQGSFDRWELKCMRKTSPLLKEWADIVLFLNYKTIVTFDEQKKAHASGGKRVIFTSHTATYDAKNRFGFPEEMPLPPEELPPELAKVIAENTRRDNVPAPGAATVSEPENVAVPDEIPVPPAPPRPLLDELKTLAKEAGISSREIQAEVAKNGVCPADMPVGNYNDATLRRIISGWAKIRQNILNSRNN